MKHLAIKALDSLAHLSHKWDEPWDNTRNDSRSDSWTVQCRHCHNEALIYFEHPHEEPEIDPELVKPCVPFKIEDIELMTMASDESPSAMRWGSTQFNPGPGIDHDRIQDCLDKGFMVVNAPRPMCGEVAWEGSFLTGIFWVASLPSIELVHHWYRYGATIVDLVTNAQVETMAEVAYAERLKLSPFKHRTWAEAVAKFGMSRAIESADRSLPYRYQTTVHALVIMLVYVQCFNYPSSRKDPCLKPVFPI